MHMESLEDDNFEEFRGGTLEINPECTRVSNDNTTEPVCKHLESNDNELNASIDSNSISNLISIPKRIWNCRQNNNNISQALVTSSAAPVVDDAQDYFTFRDGVVNRAVQECVEQLVTDGQLINTFLLTEITSWDIEKERLIILTNNSLYSIKYDFIALKQLEHKRVNLIDLEAILVGDLVYPSASLVPRLNGLANGVSDVMKFGVLQTQYCEGKLFEPSDRKCRGIRLIWNVVPPTNFTQKWNPFNNETPCLTFASHPLFRQANSLSEQQKEKFSMDSFQKALINAIEANGRECLIQHKDIVVNTYLGIGSLIYNRNSLGFFKVPKCSILVGSRRGSIFARLSGGFYETVVTKCNKQVSASV